MLIFFNYYYFFLPFWPIKRHTFIILHRFKNINREKNSEIYTRMDAVGARYSRNLLSDAGKQTIRQRHDGFPIRGQNSTRGGLYAFGHGLYPRLYPVSFATPHTHRCRNSVCRLRSDGRRHARGGTARDEKRTKL